MTKPCKLFLPLLLLLSGATMAQTTVHVLQTNAGEAYPFVKPGDTIVFDAPKDAAHKNYWVSFQDTSPCAKMTYAGTPSSPASCKVLKNTSGEVLTYSYNYLTTKPKAGKPTRPKGSSGPIVDSVVQCWYCSQVQVGGGGNDTTAGQPDAMRIARPPASTANTVNSHRVPLCTSDAKPDVAPPLTAYPGDSVQWFRNGFPNDWQVTDTESACANGPNFSHPGSDVCTVGSTLGVHHYQVQTKEGCSGTGVLTIENPPGPASANSTQPPSR